MKTRLIQWVDSTDVAPDETFSPRRVAKLFVAIMATKLIGAVPLLLLYVALLSYQRHEAAEARRQAIEESARRTQQAIANGEDVGEATLLLYGVDPAEYQRLRGDQ
jgi:hypothetical protein